MDPRAAAVAGRTAVSVDPRSPRCSNETKHDGYPVQNVAGLRMTGPDLHHSLAELVERTRHGNQRAFEALLKLLWSRVMIYVSIRGRVAAHDADAVAFDVFESLYEAIRDSHAPNGSNPASFFACVRTIAKRRVADYWRAQRTVPEAALREMAAVRAVANDAQDEFEPDELMAVEECLGGLEEEPLYLVVSHYFRGLSTRALEGQTGTPASTVRLKITRALRILRECLESHGISLDAATSRATLR